MCIKIALLWTEEDFASLLHKNAFVTNTEFSNEMPVCKILHWKTAIFFSWIFSQVLYVDLKAYIPIFLIKFQLARFSNDNKYLNFSWYKLYSLSSSHPLSPLFLCSACRFIRRISPYFSSLFVYLDLVWTKCNPPLHSLLSSPLSPLTNIKHTPLQKPGV